MKEFYLVVNGERNPNGFDNINNLHAVARQLKGKKLEVQHDGKQTPWRDPTPAKE